MPIRSVVLNVLTSNGSTAFAVAIVLPQITAPPLLICTTSLGSLNGTEPGTFCATSIIAAAVLSHVSTVPGKTGLTVKLTILIWLICPAWPFAKNESGRHSSKSLSFLMVNGLNVAVKSIASVKMGRLIDDFRQIV
jgi:hypothetical protein